jgi:hypothetical protein
MGQVRWASWTMAVATAVVITGGQVARADVASDKAAALVVFPEVKVDTKNGLDTVIRLSNTNPNTPVALHCFYVDANSHCVGGTNENAVCTSGLTAGASVCAGGGACNAPTSLQEVDFEAVLTQNQPVQWLASKGLSGTTCASGDPSCLPLPFGVCLQNQFIRCNTNDDCNPFPGGQCTPSNAGTNIPGVPEDPFVGELKCIEVDANDNPIASNDLKGEALIEKSTTATPDFDIASYNAVGIQARLQCFGGDNDGGACKSKSDCPHGACQAPPGSIGKVLTLGGEGAEYNGCSNYLILNHFFDSAVDPVPDPLDTPPHTNTITTNLVLVPCSEDLERQICGSAVIQYLVFNEFEQRFSTSRSVNCFQDRQLALIDTPDPTRSIWNVNFEGSLTGQTRINPLGTGALPSGMVGVAFETHTGTTGPKYVRSASFNLHLQGTRADKSGTPLSDTWTLP